MNQRLLPKQDREAPCSIRWRSLEHILVLQIGPAIPYVVSSSEILLTSTYWGEATAGFGSGEKFDRYGHSVAISGDTMVVGAPHADVYRPDVDHIFSEEGLAHVYLRENGLWKESRVLAIPDLIDEGGKVISASQLLFLAIRSWLAPVAGTVNRVQLGSLREKN